MTTGPLALALGAMAALESRNIEVRGRRTSMRLEPEFWRALTLVSKREDLAEHQVIALVEKRRPCGVNLSSAVRAFLLAYELGTAAD